MNQRSRFDNLMTRLFRVPHAEIKSKLDTEKAAKKKRKTRRASSDREGGSKV